MKIVSINALKKSLQIVKNALAGKEPAFSKNSGFNLTRTDAVEDNSLKVFTSKGALSLKNELDNKKLNKTGDVLSLKGDELYPLNLDLGTLTTAFARGLTFTNSAAGGKSIAGVGLNVDYMKMGMGEEWWSNSLTVNRSGEVYEMGNKRVWSTANFDPNTKLNTGGYGGSAKDLENAVVSAQNSANSKISKSGDTMSGTLSANGGININTNSEVSFLTNSDFCKIGFKNSSDADPDSYGYVKTGDNGNEYFKFISVSGSTETETLSIKTDHLRYKGNAVYHQGFKPTISDLGIPLVKNISLNWAWGSSTPTHIWGAQGDSTQSYVYNGAQLKTFVGLQNVNNWGASSAIGANSTTEYASTNMVAQVRSEKLNYSDRVNWNDRGTWNAVVGQLAWRQHNNGHTIFDASGSVTPTGVAKNNTNPEVNWSPGLPTLMGYNGNNTYGVRVDVSRYSDSSWRSSRVSGDSGGGSHVSWRDRDTIIQVDCPSSAGAASNVWKATRWGSHHIAACDVYDEMIRWVIHTDQVMSFNKHGHLSAGRVYNAVWNDYAEYFPKKEGYITEAGDIIALSLCGDEEVYELATEEHSVIVGAHSDCYGHLIGGDKIPDDFEGTSEEYNAPRYIPVGLVGRLPVKFIGVAKKGTKIVPSSIPGVGRAFDKTKDDYDKVIGYVVENNNEEGIRRVKIKIGK